MLLRVLTVFLNVLRFFGSFPFVRCDAGPSTLTRSHPEFPRRFCFEKSNLLNLWSLAVAALAVGFVLYDILLSISYLQAAGDITMKVSLVCFFTGGLLHVCMYLYLVIQSSRLRDVVENLYNLNKPEVVEYKPWTKTNIQAVSGEDLPPNSFQSKEFPRDVRKRSTIFKNAVREFPLLLRILVLVGCIALQAIENLYSNLKNPSSPTWYVSYVATVLSLPLSVALAVVFTVMLSQLARVLRDSSERLLGNASSPPLPVAIQTLQRLETFVRKTDQIQVLAMRFFGIPVFFLVAAGLVASFPLLFMITKADASVNTSSFAVLLYLLTSMCTVFSAPETLRQEREVAAERIKDVLTVTEDSQTYEKGQWLLQLLQDPPNFNILGLFTLGGHCVVEVASCTITYFIILVQFDAGSGTSPEGAAAANCSLAQ